MDSQRLEQSRGFLKDSIRLTLDFSQTAQRRGEPAPPLQKPYPSDARRVALPKKDAWQGVEPLDLVTAIGKRHSRRHFKAAALSLDAIAFLLWATQGIQKKTASWSAFRTVPSAGCRHAFETYLAVLRVTGIEPGVYRYLPIEHELLALAPAADLRARLEAATLGQDFVAQAGAVFIWTAIPERMEWRYSLAAHKAIALDAGHVCQNLYLATQAVGAGTCAVAAYDQQAMDDFVGVDGRDEFVIYLAPVGKV